MLNLHYRIIGTQPEPIRGQSRSFKLKYPHHGDGTVTITPDGVYNLSLNSWDTSDASARRTNEFKNAMFEVSNDLIKAYDSMADSYINLHGKMLKLHRRSYYEGKLPKIELETYRRKTYKIQQPTKREVKTDLDEEAKGMFYASGTSNDMSNYVNSKLDSVFSDRMKKWEEAKEFFEKIETAHEQRENAAYKAKYDSLMQGQADYMAGAEYVVKDAIDQRMANVTMPYTIDVNMSYAQDSHLMVIDVELMNGVSIPEQKATLLASGKVSVKGKLVKEIEQEKTTGMLGVLYYIASVAFDASPNIDNVRISLWDAQKQNGYGWVDFPRNELLHNTMQKFAPTLDIFSYNRVMNLKDTRGALVLAPIKASVFQKQVKAAETGL